MKKILFIVLMVCGISFVLIPVLSLIGVSCRSGENTVYADELTQPYPIVTTSGYNWLVPIDIDWLYQTRGLTEDTTFDMTVRSTVFMLVNPSTLEVSLCDFNDYGIPDELCSLMPVNLSSVEFTLSVYNHNMFNITTGFYSRPFTLGWYSIAENDSISNWTGIVDVNHFNSDITISFRNFGQLRITAYDNVGTFNPNPLPDGESREASFNLILADADNDYQLGYNDGLEQGYNDGYHEGDINGFERGYADGIANLTVGDYLGNTVDSFMNITLFGTSVTFGTILSIGFGMILLGLAIKLFLGG